MVRAKLEFLDSVCPLVLASAMWVSDTRHLASPEPLPFLPTFDLSPCLIPLVSGMGVQSLSNLSTFKEKDARTSPPAPMAPFPFPLVGM